MCPFLGPIHDCSRILLYVSPFLRKIKSAVEKHGDISSEKCARAKKSLVFPEYPILPLFQNSCQFHQNDQNCNFWLFIQAILDWAAKSTSSEGVPNVVDNCLEYEKNEGTSHNFHSNSTLFKILEIKVTEMTTHPM